MKPYITTIIPTFQRPQLLRRAINSVLAQTYPLFQVCVYDNHSLDETEAVMKELMQQDTRIHYHQHPQNIGMMSNYRYGYTRINTPYFSFLSDDDYIEPWFFETAIRDLEQFPDAGFVACEAQAVIPQGGIVLHFLTNWKKSGYFPAPEGFIEMISPPFKPPVPTCILFNYTVTHQTPPNWSEKLQILWDVDFLLQLASRHPILINKKQCGYFLSHTEGFSSGFYHRLGSSAAHMRSYLRAAKLLIQRNTQRLSLSRSDRKMIRNKIAIHFKATIFCDFISSYRKKQAIRSLLFTTFLEPFYLGFDRWTWKNLQAAIKTLINKPTNT